MNVKYHSSQNMTDPFIAKNVSKIINHKNVVILGLTDMIETGPQFIAEIILENMNIKKRP